MLRQEVENPYLLPMVQRYFVAPSSPVVEEMCSVCECRAKVKIHGERYCWDCAEFEGVEKV